MAKLLKQRMQVSFVFEVVVDDANINPLGNSEEVQILDLALLHQCLQTDQSRVHTLIADQITLHINTWTFEDILHALVGELGDIDVDTYCFRPAIHALPEPMRSAWQEILDDPTISLSECTEGIVGCFETKFVESHIVALERQPPQEGRGMDLPKI